MSTPPLAETTRRRASRAVRRTRDARANGNPSAELLERFLLPRPSVEDRLATGRRLRDRVPREDHARYQPARNRRDPVDILLDQAKTRLSDYVPIRHARMLASPFAFLRGAAAIMAGDLARTPTTGLQVQACGDLHIANFGVFASAERNLVFGINDFDETLLGPWEWDLKRLAASQIVVGQFIGMRKSRARDAVRAMVASYRERMREYAELGNLELWYSRIDEKVVLESLKPKAGKRFDALFSQARKRTHLQVLDKMTAIVNNRQRIIEDRPLIVRETHADDGTPILKVLEALLRAYIPTLNPDRRRLLAQYRVLDVARKVVGVGSVGTRCWVVFLGGNHDDDPLFLQVKEAQPSVLATYGGLPSREPSEGKRIVDGQRLIQGAPDIFLGWASGSRYHVYVRQLRDMKGSLEITPGMHTDADSPYSGLCGWALALAHARGGDAATIAGYMGRNEEFDEAIVKFAVSYAEQNERDYEAFVKAVRTGRLKADEGGAPKPRRRKST
jgi:uncharacterized protein (DUF2252 family)